MEVRLCYYYLGNLFLKSKLRRRCFRNRNLIMNLILRPVFQRYSQQWIQKEILPLDGRRISPNFQSIRCYKDFGHGRQKEPIFTKVMLGVAAFVFGTSGIRYI